MKRPSQLRSNFLRIGSKSWAPMLLLASTLACRTPEGPPSLSLLAALPPSDVEVLQRELHSFIAPLGTVNVKVRSVSPRAFQEAVEVFTPHTEGSGWDLALVPSPWLLRLDKRQAILEVPVHHVQRLSQTVSSLALLAVSAEGKTLGYPISVDVPALLLNPRFFPQVPGSLAALVSTPLPAGVLPLGLDLRNPRVVFPLLNSLPGAPPKPDVAFATQALRGPLANLASGAPLSFQLWAVPFAESAQAQLFAEGKLAALVGGPRTAALMEKVKTPYVVVPILPVCEGCYAPKPWAQVTAVVVNSLCPFPDLAQKLALELTSPDHNVALNLALHTLPVVGGREESRVLAETPFLFGFQRALNTATIPTFDETSEVWQGWELALEHFLEEQTTRKVRRAEVTP